MAKAEAERERGKLEGKEEGKLGRDDESRGKAGGRQAGRKARGQIEDVMPKVG